MSHLYRSRFGAAILASVAFQMIVCPPRTDGQPVNEEQIVVELNARERGAFWVARVPMGSGAEVRDFRLHASVVRSKVARKSRDGAHAVIISLTNSGELITIIDLKTSNLAEFMVATASLSPDAELIVYEPFQPRGQERQSSKYFAFAIRFPRNSVEPGSVFYPKDAARHSRQSAFFWVSQRTVAFLDNEDDKEVRVICTQFDKDGRVTRSATKALSVEQFVAPEGIAEMTKPIKAIANPQISRLPADSPDILQLRLHFRSSELRVRRADIVMW